MQLASQNQQAQQTVESIDKLNQKLEKYFNCKKRSRTKKKAAEKRIEMAEKNSEKMAELAKSDPWIC